MKKQSLLCAVFLLFLISLSSCILCPGWREIGVAETDVDTILGGRIPNAPEIGMLETVFRDTGQVVRAIAPALAPYMTSTFVIAYPKREEIPDEMKYKLVAEISDSFVSALQARGKDAVKMTEDSAVGQDCVLLKVIDVRWAEADLNKGASVAVFVRPGRGVSLAGSDEPGVPQDGVFCISCDWYRLRLYYFRTLERPHYINVGLKRRLYDEQKPLKFDSRGIPKFVSDTEKGKVKYIITPSPWPDSVAPGLTPASDNK